MDTSDGTPGPSQQETNEPISRRRLLLGGAAVAAAGLTSPWWASAGAAAQAPTNSFGPFSTRNSVKKTNLTLMSWELYEPTEIGAWKKIVSEFEAANPSISVTWTGWPFATYDQEVITQAEAGYVAADVIQCTPELASTLISDFAFCEPVGYIAREVGLVPAAQTDVYKVNGELYALGILVVSFVLEYDRAILASAGYDSPPTTPDEWLEYSEKLTVPSKHQYANWLVSTASSGANMWITLQNFPLAYGGAWASGPKLTIDSPENIQAMEFWVNLVKASGLTGTAYDTQQDLWYGAQIGMLLSVALGASTLKAAAPKLWPDIASAAVPWPSKKAISRLHTVNILKSSKQQAAAAELVKWMVTPENLWYVEHTNGYPLTPYSNFGDLVPEYNGFIKSLPWYTGFTEMDYVGEYDLLGDYVFAYDQLGNIIDDQIVRVFSGSATVTEALQAAQAQATESLHLEKRIV